MLLNFSKRGRPSPGSLVNGNEVLYPPNGETLCLMFIHGGGLKMSEDIMGYTLVVCSDLPSRSGIEQ